MGVGGDESAEQRHELAQFGEGSVVGDAEAVLVPVGDAGADAEGEATAGEPVEIERSQAVSKGLRTKARAMPLANSRRSEQAAAAARVAQGGANTWGTMMPW